MCRPQLAKPSIALAMLALLAISPFPLPAQAPTPGQNINMVSGTKWPDGDPFLQRQNEPSITVSSRNPRHLLAGANDYRTVDLNFFATGETGDAWLGIFKSFDAGASWQSTLLPGYPLDQTPEGMSSPLKAFNAASDPVVRPGTNGLFFYSGIAFNRGSNAGGVFVSRFIDLNNKENGNAGTGATVSNTDPVRYISTAVLDTGNAGQFLDKPWIVADVPRLGAGSCTVTVGEPGSATGTVTQSFSAGNVYVSWTRFVGGQNLIRTQIYVSRSLDCGATWSTPDKVSEGFPINQGTVMAVDPTNGNVYVAWRTFAAASTPDGISVAVSTDGGQTFSKGIQVVSLPSFDPTIPTAPSFFDLQSSGTQMRSLAFPTIAVDNASRVYIAWAERGVGPSGDARIMISNSTTNGLSWSAPTPVDNNPVTDDFSASFSRGHQLMPQLTFSGGKLMALYYDLRLDHTLGFFTPNFPFAADLLGRFYLEARTPKGELPGNPGAVFTPFLDDAGLTVRRHTVEVFVAQANPGSPPSFSPGTRVTMYRSGLRNDFTDPVAELQQLQVDPPNFPLFKGGTTPFFGDYIDIAGQTIVPQANGSWGFNTGSSSANTGSLIAPVFHATWTDNRDVRPPKDGNWQNYTPVGGGGSSTFAPGTITPSCLSGNEGMRNQNIYTSRITQGLVVSSPQNSKPLSASLQRAFVVLVQNQTNFDRSFRLSITNQPPGGFASFKAGINNPGPPASPPTPPSPVVATLDVKAQAHSGVAGSVFAVSSSPTAAITVNVDEITTPGGTLVSGGLSSFVVLNPDATTPTLINPDAAPGGTDIASLEIYNPNFSNPNYSNPNYSNPNYSNPNFSNPNYSNPNFSNPNFSNPDIAGSTVPSPNYSNGDLTNPNYSNPNYSNPNFSNTNLSSTLVSDASYTVTNKGNTNAGYDVNLVLAGKLPSNAQFQLLINKTYLTPVAQNCSLQQQQTTTVASVINNPNFSNPNFSNPNFSNPNFSNGSLSLAPGESATITVRGFNVTCAVTSGPRCQGPIPGIPMMEDVITQVAPVVTAQAANTNDPTNTPQTVAPLFIITATLPDAVTGTAYSQTLQAVGGTPLYTWTISSGALPGGLTLGPSTGVISGTPNAAGTFAFTVQVTDSSSPTALTAAKPLTIRVAAPLMVATASPLPTGCPGCAYGPVTLSASGGIPPYSWTPVANIDGLSLNSSGVLSGALTLPGTFNFTAQVTDNASPVQIATKSMTLNVACPTIVAFSQQPSNVVAGLPITPPVLVRVTDCTGAVIPGTNVTMSLGTAPSGAVLSGTLTQTTSATGVATFSDLSANAAGTYTLVASSGTVTTVSNSFSVSNPVPFFGQATDPVGDANGGGTNPDLVWGSVTTFNNGSVKLMVRYASGTFNSSTTEAQFLLDTDRNTATGSPGSNAGCADDAGNLGVDYLVVLRSAFASNQATIFKATGGCNSYAVLGTAPVTIFTDGMDVTFPLSTLVNTATANTSGPATSGPWNFKVTTDFSIGGNSFSGLIDTMPNIGLVPASTASAPLPITPPSGMVAWYPADGYPTDIQNNHGGLFTNIAYAPSEVGQSFVFDGTSSFITITDSADLKPAAVTVDFWFKSNVNLSGNPNVPFLFKLNPADDANSNSKGYDFFYQFGGPGFGLAGPGGLRFFAQVGATFTAGTWHHVAGTYDPTAPVGTAQKLYLDGTLVSSTCGPSTTGPTFNPSSTNCTPASINYQAAAIEVGRVINSANFPPSQTTPYFFNGQIDEIEIYNRALSASEIQAIFNAGSAGKAKP